MRALRAVSKQYQVAGFDIGRGHPQAVQESRFKALRCAKLHFPSREV
jgi:hypothetical protein